MDRTQNEDRLSAYFDGELPLNERSEMEARLSESPELRRTLADFQMQRQGLLTLAAPALPIDFSDRIMERVLAVAAASAPVIPPPFPVKAKRRFTPALIAGLISVAAMVALTAFLTRGIWNPPAGGSGPVIVDSGNSKPVVGEDNDSSNTEALNTEVLPETKVDRDPDGSAIASNNNAPTETHVDPNVIVGANPAKSSPGETLPKTNALASGEKPVEPIANANKKAPDSNARLIDNLPKAAAYAAATSKSRPKAYRVQIGARSEFEIRLKEIGVSIFHGKAVDPPSGIPRAQPFDLLPDPEYVIVEGSEKQLAELVEKLGAQADLMLHEPKGDLEAEMLIEALCSMDLSAKPVRPSEAKEGEFAAFTLPARAFLTLLPAEAPTGNKPNTLAGSERPRNARTAPPNTQPKTSSGDESSLFVPRVLFILDVRMGEAEGAGTKK